MGKLKIMMMCDFCAQYVQRTSQNFWAQLWGKQYGQKSDVIFESDNLFVIAGLGALTEGYVLLVPKLHCLSVAQLPETIISELEALKSQLRSILEEAYGKPVVFYEHGAMSESKRAGACVDHAHIHALPCEGDIRVRLQEHFSEKRIQSLTELTKFAVTGTPYLYYETALGEMFVYEVSTQLPSQFVRRIWASLLGKPNEWDWSLFIGEDKVANTINKLRPWFSKEIDHSPV